MYEGMENLDSGVGVYAPDAESYSLFADLFDPIICDYHTGFKSGDQHPPRDFGDVETLGNLDPEVSLIHASCLELISNFGMCNAGSVHHFDPSPLLPLFGGLPVQPLLDRGPVRRDGAESFLCPLWIGGRTEGHLLPLDWHDQRGSEAAD